MSDKFSYSSNQDDYQGEFETREAAIEEAKAEGLTHFWTGRNRPPEMNLWCLRADSVIENIINNEDDFSGEASESWPGTTKEQEDELTIALQATFHNWMVRHNLKPTWWIVEDVLEHKIEEATAPDFAILDELLQGIMPNLPKARRDLYLPFLDTAMHKYEINTPLRAAAFLAQLAHESAELRFMQELWGPTAQQKKYEPPTDLAKTLGNTQPGDGFRYRGRGPIQITGRANYKKYGDLLGVDLVGNPDLAAQPEYAFQLAGTYWETHGLNEKADAEDFKGITKAINGGYNGLPEREKYYETAKKALGVEE
jgi:predicted chitinase